MLKKLSLLALLVGAVALVGCGKKFNCKNIAEKNSKCADAIVDAMLKDMGDKIPDAMKKTMKEKMKKELAGDKFQEECKKNWDSKKEKDKKMKKTLEDCFKKSDCKAYAECLAKAMK